MEKIKFKDFRIIPDISSVRKEEINDETYFSSAYGHYISNSRLKWIDPSSDGTPALFKNPPKLKTSSLYLGGIVHECLLQPDEFSLGPKIGKPSAKLGEVMEAIPKFLEEGLGLDDAIKQAVLKVNYYANCVDCKIEQIKESWEKYNKVLSNLESTNKTVRIVSDKDWDVVNGCLDSCLNNKSITDLLHPVSIFGDPIESYCEDAFFIDYIVTYKGKYCTTLKFKMKADNWTIDYDNKVVTLNDLKTTSHPVQNFMKESGSFYNFKYMRQMAVYGQILWYYLMKNCGVTKQTGWKFNANMLVVETIPHFWSKAYSVSDEELRNGIIMLNQLLSRVAYYEIFGYDKEVEFE